MSCVRFVSRFFWLRNHLDCPQQVTKRNKSANRPNATQKLVEAKSSTVSGSLVRDSNSDIDSYIDFGLRKRMQNHLLRNTDHQRSSGQLAVQRDQSDAL